MKDETRSIDTNMVNVSGEITFIKELAKGRVFSLGVKSTNEKGYSLVNFKAFPNGLDKDTATLLSKLEKGDNVVIGGHFISSSYQNTITIEVCVDDITIVS